MIGLSLLLLLFQVAKVSVEDFESVVDEVEADVEPAPGDLVYFC